MMSLPVTLAHRARRRRAREFDTCRKRDGLRRSKRGQKKTCRRKQTTDQTVPDLRLKTRPSDTLQTDQDQDQTRTRPGPGPDQDQDQDQIRTKIRTRPGPGPRPDKDQIRTKTGPDQDPDQIRTRTRSGPGPVQTCSFHTKSVCLLMNQSAVCKSSNLHTTFIQPSYNLYITSDSVISFKIKHEKHNITLTSHDL